MNISSSVISPSTNSGRNGTATAVQSTIVLVHGAFVDVYVWARVSANLQARGFRVIGVNLPGRPSAGSPTGHATIDAYRDTVLAAIEEEYRPVVLVGHGFGGIVASAVAEAAPYMIKTIVYLSAYLPQDGDSMFSLMKQDGGRRIVPALDMDTSRDRITVDYALRADLFANGAPQDIRDLVPDLIVDESLLPMLTPVTLTAARFAQVDKVYIHTANDLIVSPGFQEQMVTNTPVRLRLHLDTGHSPYLTDAAALTSAIENAVG